MGYVIACPLTVVLYLLARRSEVIRDRILLRTRSIWLIGRYELRDITSGSGGCPSCKRELKSAVKHCTTWYQYKQMLFEKQNISGQRMHSVMQRYEMHRARAPETGSREKLESATRQALEMLVHEGLVGFKS